MARLMSVTLTEQAVVERRKTVTRRLGWYRDKNDRVLLKVGDKLTLCRKVMGRKKGEEVVRLAEVEVVDISRQQLRISNTPDEAAREGFPDWTWELFVAFFCAEMRVTPDTIITRIEWRYLDETPPKVVDLMAALEDSVAAAKAARREHEADRAR